MEHGSGVDGGCYQNGWSVVIVVVVVVVSSIISARGSASRSPDAIPTQRSTSRRPIPIIILPFQAFFGVVHCIAVCVRFSPGAHVIVEFGYDRGINFCIQITISAKSIALFRRHVAQIRRGIQVRYVCGGQAVHIGVRKSIAVVVHVPLVG